MIDTRNPARPSKTFSRSYVAPELQAHLDQGGTVEEWLGGRTPIAPLARISADRLKGDAIGIGRQHKNNARNAAPHNCAVVVCYEDNNITAAKREVVRPAFVAMIKDITHGYEAETGIRLQGCIAVERERVWRLPRDFIALQDALLKKHPWDNPEIAAVSIAAGSAAYLRRLDSSLSDSSADYSG